MQNKDLNMQDVALAHKLTLEEYENIKKILGREPNLVEIGIFSAMWSEHCSYKSSRKYLSGFPTEAPWVIQGPGENAGVIDIGEGYAAVFKMESHNHPSFIDPYEGAATGVGGVLRDIFTMGARPVASLSSMRFSNLEGDDELAKKHRWLLKGAVDGTANYGNKVGVPIIGGEVSFEECYAGNILVNAFNLGIVKSDEVFYAKAEGVGNPVVYVGKATGKEGVGAAVMSSDSFDDSLEENKPKIQGGDPEAERRLLEACLEIFTKDLIVGVQDMGAAGLTSSSFEMAGKSGSGMIMHLEKVPAREKNMTPYEFMLSESQERMLFCAKKGCEQEIIDIVKKWDLEAAVIGEVTDSGNMELFFNGEKVAEIPVQPVSEEAPMYDRPVKDPEYLKTIADINLDKEISNQIAYDELISDLEVVDKAWIYNQFEQNENVIKKPGTLDGSTIKVEGTNIALSMSADCNTRFCYINPKLGAAAAVMESGRNVAMSGARPKAITDCLNFGNPQNPEVMWQFKESCEGIKESCLALNTPVVSGNVSLYNETNTTSIYPTPSIAVVGVNSDANNVLASSFQNSGNILYLLGDTKSEFGGSLYLKKFYGKVAGTHPSVDFAKELSLWDTVIEANENKLLTSAKDVNIGGIAVSISKMAIHSNIGVEANISLNDSKDIFAESLSRAIVEVEPKNCQAFEKIAEKHGIMCVALGKTGGDKIAINDIYKNLSDVSKVYFNKFKEVIES